MRDLHVLVHIYIYKAGEILDDDIMVDKNIYEWMRVCLKCVNEINNDTFNDEDGTSNNNNNNNNNNNDHDDEDEYLNIYMILQSFIDMDEPSVMEIDIYPPFGPGEQLTAENYFF